MEGAVTRGAGEQRASMRRSPPPQSWLATARVRPGHEVRVIDLSSGGVLVEAATRLLPGARVVLQFIGPGVALRASARVVRCFVVALDPEHGVRYRAALAFDRELDVFADEMSSGYGVSGDQGDGPVGQGQCLPEAR
jgi:hypothetical protein